MAQSHISPGSRTRQLRIEATYSPDTSRAAAACSPLPCGEAGAPLLHDGQCDVTADTPHQSSTTGNLLFSASTYCSEDVPRSAWGQDVIHSTPDHPGQSPWRASNVVTNDHFATTQNIAVCQPGQHAVSASVRITLPDGYVVTGSLHDTSATVTFTCGSGGGGGCATATPSVSGQPATRRPDLIVCQ